MKFNKKRFVQNCVVVGAALLLVIEMLIATSLIIDIHMKVANAEGITTEVEIEEQIVEAAVEDVETVEPVEPVPSIKYISLGVPTNVDTSFKTYMDWRKITDETSAQYTLVRDYGWHDANGFMRVNGDEGSEYNEYYLIALGSYYGTDIGAKYRITTDKGNVFYGILGDAKADEHTNSTNQYAGENDVVEFLVDTRYLHKKVKITGSANVYSPLEGNIAKIERIEF